VVEHRLSKFACFRGVYNCVRPKITLTTISCADVAGSQDGISRETRT